MGVRFAKKKNGCDKERAVNTVAEENNINMYWASLAGLTHAPAV